MLRLRRYERVTRFSHAETAVALTEANWYLTNAGEQRNGGFSYRAPTSVVVDGMQPVRIHDYVMIARLGALAAAAAILLRGVTSRRKHSSQAR